MSAYEFPKFVFDTRTRTMEQSLNSPSGLVTFRCHLCQFGTDTKHELVTHMFDHAVECSSLDFQRPSQSQMNKSSVLYEHHHKAQVESAPNPDDSDTDEVSCIACAFCNFMTFSKNRLIRHTSFKHPGVVSQNVSKKISQTLSAKVRQGDMFYYSTLLKEIDAIVAQQNNQDSNAGHSTATPAQNDRRMKQEKKIVESKSLGSDFLEPPNPHDADIMNPQVSNANRFLVPNSLAASDGNQVKRETEFVPNFLESHSNNANIMNPHISNTNTGFAHNNMSTSDLNTHENDFEKDEAHVESKPFVPNFIEPDSKAADLMNSLAFETATFLVHNSMAACHLNKSEIKKEKEFVKSKSFVPNFLESDSNGADIMNSSATKAAIFPVRNSARILDWNNRDITMDIDFVDSKQFVPTTSKEDKDKRACTHSTMDKITEQGMGNLVIGIPNNKVLTEKSTGESGDEQESLPLDSVVRGSMVSKDSHSIDQRNDKAIDKQGHDLQTFCRISHSDIPRVQNCEVMQETPARNEKCKENDRVQIELTSSVNNNKEKGPCIVCADCDFMTYSAQRWHRHIADVHPVSTPQHFSIRVVSKSRRADVRQVDSAYNSVGKIEICVKNDVQKTLSAVGLEVNGRDRKRATADERSDKKINPQRLSHDISQTNYKDRLESQQRRQLSQRLRDRQEKRTVSAIEGEMKDDTEDDIDNGSTTTDDDSDYDPDEEINEIMDLSEDDDYDIYRKRKYKKQHNRRPKGKCGARKKQTVSEVKRDGVRYSNNQLNDKNFNFQQVGHSLSQITDNVLLGQNRNKQLQRQSIIGQTQSLKKRKDDDVSSGITETMGHVSHDQDFGERRIHMMLIEKPQARDIRESFDKGNRDERKMTKSDVEDRAARHQSCHQESEIAAGDQSCHQESEIAAGDQICHQEPEIAARDQICHQEPEVDAGDQGCHQELEIAARYQICHQEPEIAAGDQGCHQEPEIAARHESCHQEPEIDAGDQRCHPEPEIAARHQGCHQEPEIGHHESEIAAGDQGCHQESEISAGDQGCHQEPEIGHQESEIAAGDQGCHQEPEIAAGDQGSHQEPEIAAGDQGCHQEPEIAARDQGCRQEPEIAARDQGCRQQTEINSQATGRPHEILSQMQNDSEAVTISSSMEECANEDSTDEKKIIFCEECDQTFSTRGNLSRHVKVVHRGIRMFQCDRCGMRFEDGFHLRGHKNRKRQCVVSQQSDDSDIITAPRRSSTRKKTSAEKQMKLLCRECPRMFTREYNLQSHIAAVHQGINRFICDVCGRVFGALQHLHAHRICHDKHVSLRRPGHYKELSEVHPCQVCHIAFTTSHLLDNHMRRLHVQFMRNQVNSSDPEKQKTVMCRTCRMTFEDRDQFLKHVKIHEKEKPFQCPECDKSFRVQENLNMHLKTHSGGERPKADQLIESKKSTKKPLFECNVCFKTFTCRSNLYKHARIHTGIKPFKCDQCSMAYSDSSNLRKHVVSHTGVKTPIPYKYTCNECDKVFQVNADLKRHMTIHTGLKPHVCPECSKAFRLKSFLKNHMRIHTGDTPFVCKHCSRSFIERSVLNSHVKTHDRIKCKWCGEKFKLKSDLLEHLKTHRKEKPYACKICRKAFTESGFALHELTHKRYYFSSDKILKDSKSSN